MIRENLQLDDHGRLKHFLAIEGLDRELLLTILNTAESFAGVSVVSTPTSTVTVPAKHADLLLDHHARHRTRQQGSVDAVAEKETEDRSGIGELHGVP